MVPLGRVFSMVASHVVPATRLMAPGAEGPNVVLQELSLNGEVLGRNLQ